jgi:hypothetical protein
VPTPNAANNQPTPAVQSTSDPFDLGDTGLYPASTASQQAATPAEAAESVAQGSTAVTTEHPPQARDAAGRFVPAEATAAAHPAYLVEAARDLGFSEDEIADLPTAKLHNVVHRWQQAQARHRDRDATQRTLDRPAGTSPEGPGAPAAPVGAPAPADDVAIDLGIDEGDYDPVLLGGIKKALKNVLAPYQQKIKALEAVVGELRTREVHRENETNAERLDRAFAGLGDKEFLGDGPGRTLKGDSPEFSRRMAILNEAARLTGTKTPSVQQVIDQVQKAHKNLFGGRSQPTAAPAPQQPAKSKDGHPTPEEWARGGVQVPTARQQPALPPGEERAKRNLREKFKEAGTGEDAEDSEIMNGLL